MIEEEPKYVMLTKWIKDQIISGNSSYGEKFYSENELSQMFSISRQTVRQAVGQLNAQGYLERRQGSGTYVIYEPRTMREKTMNIAVISTYLDDYIFANIIKGIERMLTRNRYSMQLTFTHNRVEKEARALESMLEKDIDGLIIEPTKSGLPNPNKKLYNEIKRKNIPVVFFNARYPDMDYPCISMDDRMAGYLVTKYLADAGHRKIAAMFQSDDMQGHLRYSGYLEALSSSGLDIKSDRILWYTTEHKKYLFNNPEAILNRIKGATGIVCYNDQLASNMIKFLKENGIKVSEDLSVISIDNADIASMCDVPLTTAAHPMQMLGETAANNLLKLIDDPYFDASCSFCPKIIERESVRNLN